MMTLESLEKQNKVHETPYIKMWEKEGILFCKYPTQIEIDLKIAKECVKSRVEFSKGKAYPLFVNLKGVKSISKEAREYLAGDGAVLVNAGVLITDSPLTRILGNAFLMINKPKIPSRIFTDGTQAIEWLKKYA